MHSAEDFLFHQRKLLSCGKLPFARKAGETRQVIDVSFSPPDPVSRVDVPAASRAASSIPSTVHRKAGVEDFNAWEATDQSTIKLTHNITPLE